MKLDHDKLAAGATVHLEWTLYEAHWVDSARPLGSLMLLSRDVRVSGPSWVMPSPCIVSSERELLELELTPGVSLASMIYEPGPPLPRHEFPRVPLLQEPTQEWWLEPDGTVHHLDVVTNVRQPETRTRTITHVLRRASLAMPGLTALLPPPPPGASTCPMCAGLGLASDGGGVCWCNGLGWE